MLCKPPCAPVATEINKNGSPAILLRWGQRRFSASSSSSVRGQSLPSRRERPRSASSLPPVWQRAQ